MGSVSVEGRRSAPAPGKNGYAEDLPVLAQESFALAQGLCRDCDEFHALWPYLRIARKSREVTAGIGVLESRLAQLFAAGAEQVALAGAGDTGLLSTVARAGAGRPRSIVAIDRCATPLELCRRFAERWSLPVDILRQDLRDLDLEDRFDIVLAHSVLSFIAAPSRLDVLRRFNRSLRRGGRLVLKFNTGHPMAEPVAREYHYADTIIATLEGAGVPLPEPRAAFRARLDAFGPVQAGREVALESTKEVEALLDAAGFALEDCTPIETKRAAIFGYHADVARQSFLATAKPIAEP